MKTKLNPTELELLQILWEEPKIYLKDILSLHPEPKPAYTTISTLLTRMYKKGLVDFEKEGRDKKYFAVLKKEDYLNNQISGLFRGFFNNSITQFSSFFAKKNELSIEELESLKRLVDEKIKEKGN